MSPGLCGMQWLIIINPAPFALWRIYMCYTRGLGDSYSQCKMKESLPNFQIGRSKPLIYDISWHLNLNANAFSSEPVDGNLNWQAYWLLTAVSTTR